MRCRLISYRKRCGFYLSKHYDTGDMPKFSHIFYADLFPNLQLKTTKGTLFDTKAITLSQ